MMASCKFVALGHLHLHLPSHFRLCPASEKTSRTDSSREQHATIETSIESGERTVTDDNSRSDMRVRQERRRRARQLRAGSLLWHRRASSDISLPHRRALLDWRHNSFLIPNLARIGVSDQANRAQVVAMSRRVDRVEIRKALTILLQGSQLRRLINGVLQVVFLDVVEDAASLCQLCAFRVGTRVREAYAAPPLLAP